MTLFISIHALREEGDEDAITLTGNSYGFLSTPSARRATSQRRTFTNFGVNFYPRPPRGGRLFIPRPIMSRKIISIHALREEGDLSQLLLSKRLAISIHALREEGDFVNCVMLPDME